MKKHDIVMVSLLGSTVEAYVLTVSNRSADATVVLLDDIGAYKKGDRISVPHYAAIFVRKSK